MNLEIRRLDDRTTALTNEAGRPLPGQVAVAWEHGGPGERAAVTVTFIVDGVNVRVGDGPVTAPTGSLPEAAAAFAALSPANRARFLTMHELTTVWRAAEMVDDKVEGLEEDLYQAVLTAYRRGAVDWARWNYPNLMSRLVAEAGEKPDGVDTRTFADLGGEGDRK